MKLWRDVLVFLVGLALGVTLVLVGPRVAGPFLPEALRGKAEVVEGEVAKKLREQDKLLVTLVNGFVVILITFKQNVAEGDLLVEDGDKLSLRVLRVETFVDVPVVQSVEIVNEI